MLIKITKSYIIIVIQIIITIMKKWVSAIHVGDHCNLKTKNSKLYDIQDTNRRRAT